MESLNFDTSTITENKNNIEIEFSDTDDMFINTGLNINIKKEKQKYKKKIITISETDITNYTESDNDSDFNEFKEKNFSVFNKFLEQTVPPPPSDDNNKENIKDKILIGNINNISKKRYKNQQILKCIEQYKLLKKQNEEKIHKISAKKWEIIYVKALRVGGGIVVKWGIKFLFSNYFFQILKILFNNIKDRSLFFNPTLLGLFEGSNLFNRYEIQKIKNYLSVFFKNHEQMGDEESKKKYLTSFKDSLLSIFDPEKDMNEELSPFVNMIKNKFQPSSSLLEYASGNLTFFLQDAASAFDLLGEIGKVFANNDLTENLIDELIDQEWKQTMNEFTNVPVRSIIRSDAINNLLTNCLSKTFNLAGENLFFSFIDDHNTSLALENMEGVFALVFQFGVSAAQDSSANYFAPILPTENKKENKKKIDPEEKFKMYTEMVKKNNKEDEKNRLEPSELLILLDEKTEDPGSIDEDTKNKLFNLHLKRGDYFNINKSFLYIFIPSFLLGSKSLFKSIEYSENFDKNKKNLKYGEALLKDSNIISNSLTFIRIIGKPVDILQKAFMNYERTGVEWFDNYVDKMRDLVSKGGNTGNETEGGIINGIIRYYLINLIEVYNKKITYIGKEFLFKIKYETKKSKIYKEYFKYYLEKSFSKNVIIPLFNFIMSMFIYPYFKNMPVIASNRIARINFFDILKNKDLMTLIPNIIDVDKQFKSLEVSEIYERNDNGKELFSLDKDKLKDIVDEKKKDFQEYLESIIFGKNDYAFLKSRTAQFTYIAISFLLFIGIWDSIGGSVGAVLGGMQLAAVLADWYFLGFEFLEFVNNSGLDPQGLTARVLPDFIKNYLQKGMITNYLKDSISSLSLKKDSTSEFEIQGQIMQMLFHFYQEMKISENFDKYVKNKFATSEGEIIYEDNDYMVTDKKNINPNLNDDEIKIILLCFKKYKKEGETPNEETIKKVLKDNLDDLFQKTNVNKKLITDFLKGKRKFKTNVDLNNEFTTIDNLDITEEISKYNLKNILGDITDIEFNMQKIFDVDCDQSDLIINDMSIKTFFVKIDKITKEIKNIPDKKLKLDFSGCEKEKVDKIIGKMKGVWEGINGDDIFDNFFETKEVSVQATTGKTVSIKTMDKLMINLIKQRKDIIPENDETKGSIKLLKKNDISSEKKFFIESYEKKVDLDGTPHIITTYNERKVDSSFDELYEFFDISIREIDSENYFDDCIPQENIKIQDFINRESSTDPESESSSPNGSESSSGQVSQDELRKQTNDCFDLIKNLLESYKRKLNNQKNIKQTEINAQKTKAEQDKSEIERLEGEIIQLEKLINGNNENLIKHIIDKSEITVDSTLDEFFEIYNLKTKEKIIDSLDYIENLIKTINYLEDIIVDTTLSDKDSKLKKEDIEKFKKNKDKLQKELDLVVRGTSTKVQNYKKTKQIIQDNNARIFNSAGNFGDLTSFISGTHQDRRREYIRLNNPEIIETVKDSTRTNNLNNIGFHTNEDWFKPHDNLKLEGEYDINFNNLASHSLSQFIDLKEEKLNPESQQRLLDLEELSHFYSEKFFSRWSKSLTGTRPGERKKFYSESPEVWFPSLAATMGGSWGSIEQMSRWSEPAEDSDKDVLGNAKIRPVSPWHKEGLEATAGILQKLLDGDQINDGDVGEQFKKAFQIPTGAYSAEPESQRLRYEGHLSDVKTWVTETDFLKNFEDWQEGWDEDGYIGEEVKIQVEVAQWNADGSPKLVDNEVVTKTETISINSKKTMKEFFLKRQMEHVKAMIKICEDAEQNGGKIQNSDLLSQLNIIYKQNLQFTKEIENAIKKKKKQFEGLMDKQKRVRFINFNKKILGDLVSSKTPKIDAGLFVQNLNNCYNNQLTGVFNKNFENRLSKSLEEFQGILKKHEKNLILNEKFKKLDLSTLEIQLILQCKYEKGGQEQGDKDILHKKIDVDNIEHVLKFLTIKNYIWPFIKWATKNPYDEQIYILFKNTEKTMDLFSENELKRNHAENFFKDNYNIEFTFDKSKFNKYRERLEYVMKIIHHGNLNSAINLNNELSIENLDKEKSMLEQIEQEIDDQEDESQDISYKKILDEIFEYYESLSTGDTAVLDDFIRKGIISQEDVDMLRCLKTFKDVSVKDISANAGFESILSANGMNQERWEECRNLLKRSEGETLGFDFDLDLSEYSNGFIRNKANLLKIYHKVHGIYYKIYYKTKKEEIYDQLQDIPKIGSDIFIRKPTIYSDKIEYHFRDRFDPKSLEQEERAAKGTMAEGKEKAMERKKELSQQQQVTGLAEVERPPTTENVEGQKTTEGNTVKEDNKEAEAEGEAEGEDQEEGQQEKQQEDQKEAEAEKNEEANKLAEAFSNIAPQISKYLKNLGKIIELSQSGDPKTSESFNEEVDEFEEEVEDMPEDVIQKRCNDNKSYWVPTATGGIKIIEGATLDPGTTKNFIIKNCLEQSGFNLTLGNFIDGPITLIEGVLNKIITDSLDKIKSIIIYVFSQVYVPPVTQTSGIVRKMFWDHMNFSTNELPEPQPPIKETWSKIIGILFAKITIFKSLFIIKIKVKILSTIINKINSFTPTTELEILYVGILKKLIISTKLFQDVSRFYADPDYIQTLVLRNRIQDIRLIDKEILTDWEMGKRVGKAAGAAGGSGGAALGGPMGWALAAASAAPTLEAYRSKNSFFNLVKQNYLESLNNEIFNISNNNRGGGNRELLNEFLTSSYSQLIGKNDVTSDILNIENFVNNDSMVHEKINFSLSLNKGKDTGSSSASSGIFFGCLSKTNLKDFNSLHDVIPPLSELSNMNINTLDPLKNKILDFNKGFFNCIEGFNHVDYVFGGGVESPKAGAVDPLNGIRYEINNFRSIKGNAEKLENNEYLKEHFEEVIKITTDFSIYKSVVTENICPILIITNMMIIKMISAIEHILSFPIGTSAQLTSTGPMITMQDKINNFGSKIGCGNIGPPFDIQGIINPQTTPSSPTNGPSPPPTITNQQPAPLKNNDRVEIIGDDQVKVSGYQMLIELPRSSSTSNFMLPSVVNGCNPSFNGWRTMSRTGEKVGVVMCVCEGKHHEVYVPYNRLKYVGPPISFDGPWWDAAMNDARSNNKDAVAIAVKEIWKKYNPSHELLTNEEKFKARMSKWALSGGQGLTSLLNALKDKYEGSNSGWW